VRNCGCVADIVRNCVDCVDCVGIVKRDCIFVGLVGNFADD
jgi:hypothetical protein